ncbi:hypothetical protein BaRGS_00005965 [Batillaria attramentaria]|uniref:Uncharacterized protein n=1 Tax=Batillaria attramentaria TaxID=370345 RepID=A0ABD0LSY8_9CAEN
MKSTFIDNNNLQKTIKQGYSTTLQSSLYAKSHCHAQLAQNAALSSPLKPTGTVPKCKTLVTGHAMHQLTTNVARDYDQPCRVALCPTVSDDA